nr:MAG TPA: hypothetical protein [Caudoviricetes sp.]
MDGLYWILGIKMNHSKQFTVGSTPLHISQRVDKVV